jgi:hypothetical protein
MVGSLMLSISALPFSVKVCHLGLIILVFNWILEGNWKEKWSVLNQSLLLHLITGYLALTLLGLLFANDVATGWFSFEKKIFLVLLPVCLATTSVRLQSQEVKSILAAFIIACFAGSVYCVIHAWQEASLIVQGQRNVDPYLAGSLYSSLHPEAPEGWLVFSYISLAKGINIHPTYFSAFLAFCIVFLLHELPMLRPRGQRIVALFLIGWFSVFTIFLASRIVIVALLVILLAVAIKSLSARQTSFAALAITLTVILSTLLVINPVSRYRSLEEIAQSSFKVHRGTNYTTSTQIRYSLWWLSFESLKTWNPLTGYGTGEAQKAMATTAESLGITNSIKSSDPHNQFLYSLLAHGIPGLVLLLLILGLPLYWAWCQRNFLLLAFGFLFCLLCVTESALELQKGIAFYSIISGLLFFQLNTYHHFSLDLKFLARVDQ